MGTSIQTNKTTQILISLAALVVIVAGMMAARQILVPFLLAVFIATLLSGPLFWMRDKGIPLWIALLILVAAVVLLQTTLAGIIGSSVNNFLKNMSFYETKLDQQTKLVMDWLGNLGLEIDENFLDKILDTGSIMRMTGTLLNSLGGVFTNIVMVLLMVVFMLLEASGFSGKFERKKASLRSSARPLDSIVGDVKNYMASKASISLVTGGLVFLLLVILGVDFPVLWALLAFIFNFIPSIGSFIAAIPAVLLAFIQLDPLRAGLVAAGYILINFVIGSIIEPRFMGRGLGLSTLVVVLSLFFWGWVLGPVGMLLSVPLSIVVKIFLESSDETRWIAVLLGPKVPPPAEAADDDPAEGVSPDDESR